MFEKHKSDIMDMVSMRKLLWENVYTKHINKFTSEISNEFKTQVFQNLHTMQLELDIDMYEMSSEFGYNLPVMEGVNAKVSKSMINFLTELNERGDVSDEIYETCMINPQMLFFCTMVPSINTSTHHRIKINL